MKPSNARSIGLNAEQALLEAFRHSRIRTVAQIKKHLVQYGISDSAARKLIWRLLDENRIQMTPDVRLKLEKIYRLPRPVCKIDIYGEHGCGKSTLVGLAFVISDRLKSDGLPCKIDYDWEKEKVHLKVTFPSPKKANPGKKAGKK